MMSLSPSSSSSGRVILAAIPTGTQLTFCNHLGNGRGGRTSQKEKRAKKNLQLRRRERKRYSRCSVVGKFSSSSVLASVLALDLLSMESKKRCKSFGGGWMDWAERRREGSDWHHNTHPRYDAWRPKIPFLSWPCRMCHKKMTLFFFFVGSDDRPSNNWSLAPKFRRTVYA